MKNLDDFINHIKIVNAGNCIICGKPIKLEDSDEFPNIFFCRECESKLKKRQESEES